tara:strand:- start:732 stop:965 length:234 start_codon:yes stop_codon:yes gene_type:complete
MVEFLMSNWMIAVGVIALGVGSFYIPFLNKFIMVGFRSLLTEKVMTKMIVMLLEKAVKSSSNKLDDLWLAQMKKKLQ